MRMSARKPTIATAISLGRKGRFMASAFGRNGGPRRGGWRGSGIGFLSFEALDILQREHHFVGAANDNRRDTVPLVHDLELDESGILLERISANHDRLGLAFRADD